MNPKIFSFFSGAGFLDLGFETEGYKVVHVNENHAPFLGAYQYSRKPFGIENPEYGYCPNSVTDYLNECHSRRLQETLVDSKKDGSLAGFIGGPPCPDFSIAGKNRGHEGERGQLSRTYIELICRHKPDFFLFENVKGLWTTKRHRQFYEGLKQSLWSAGYATTERLINSLEFGAPQDRARIILIGFKKDIVSSLVKRKLFGKFELEAFPWQKFASFPNDQAFSFPWPATSEFTEETDLACPLNIPVELTVEHWFRENEVENHPNSSHCFTPKAGLVRFQSVPEGDDKKKSFKRLHRWRYSPTAAYGNNEVHLHPYKPRRISVAEALAIQSLPKDFSLPSEMTLSNMFKTVGNGVPFLAAKMLARSINSFLEVNYAQTDSLRHRKSHRQVA